MHFSRIQYSRTRAIVFAGYYPDTKLNLVVVCTWVTNTKINILVSTHVRLIVHPRDTPYSSTRRPKRLKRSTMKA
jgi:hypothetical protein